MIYDKIENIDKYAEIPEFAVKFIEGLSEDIATGRYELGGENYANVECYTTKSHDICKPEAHKKYIDIQLLLSGHELLQFTGVDELKISEEYDKNRDIMFFKKPEYPLNTVMLVKGVLISWDIVDKNSFVLSINLIIALSFIEDKPFVKTLLTAFS